MNKSRNRRRWLPAGLLPLFASLFIISVTLAASSANYVVSFDQIGAGGAEGGSSTSYRLNTTIGQAVAGNGSSVSYHAYLGYRQTFPTITPSQTPGGSTATPHPTNTPQPTSTPGGPTPTDCPNVFVDITSNIFYTAIHYLNCRGVVNGTDNTHYSPAGTSTRGQFAKVVVLGFGTTFYTPGTPDFTDVHPGYFAYLYIESGFHAGILSGYDPNGCTAHGATPPCYLPNIPITRGQLTKLVVNAGGYTLYTPTGGIQDFTDVPTGNVFYVSIETAAHNSIINGYPDHTFRPNNNIRRDEMAQIVYEGILNKP
jgi:hypothetical protein